VIKLKFAAVVWKEGNQWVSLCPEFGVASQGDSPEHAIEMLKEAVELYIENAKELGIWRRREKGLAFTTTIEV